MPLIKSKSKQALSKNIATEMEAGKPQKQSLAISYDMKRRTPKGKKMMAKGGEIQPPAKSPEMPPKPKMEEMSEMMPKPKLQRLAHGGMAASSVVKPRLRSDIDQELMKQHEEHLMRSMPPEDETEHIQYDDEHAEHSNMMADGGEVEPEDMPEMYEDEEQHHDSIASAIMARRKRMAAGGQVDIESNEMEQPNSFYEQNEDAALKENYDDDIEDLMQPMDSNEDRPSIPTNKHDRISAIRARMKSRR